MSSPETRELARWLLAREVNADDSTVPSGTAALRVFEKLRQALGVIAGAQGFISIASRALSLAKSESPELGSWQIASDGSIKTGIKEMGFDGSMQNVSLIEAAFGAGLDPGNEDAVFLIANLIGLLSLLLGRTLTLSLLQTVWPDASFDSSNAGDRSKE